MLINKLTEDVAILISEIQQKTEKIREKGGTVGSVYVYPFEDDVLKIITMISGEQIKPSEKIKEEDKFVVTLS